MTGPNDAPVNHAPSAGPGERRACVRLPFFSETLCQPSSDMGHELWWQATAYDLSASGLGVVLNRWFGPGTVLEIELQNRTTNYSEILLARVIYAQMVPPGGGWFLGCSFVQPLSEDQLKALL